MKYPAIFRPITANLSNISIILFIFVLFAPAYLISDERTENIDVFLVLDKSLSMVEEIDAVTDYVNEEIVEKTLIPGDFFLVLQFYGEAELLLATEVGSSGTERADLERTMREVVADGHFTDIGNALDTLQTTLSRYDNRDRRRYMLLITDGKQEAPPESKYYSPDGEFNHVFLENSKVIQKQGWKIHILGIGAGSAARELADALSGTFTEVDEEPTAAEMAEETAKLLGSVRIAGPATARAFSPSGRSRLTLPLEVSGYEESVTIEIERIFVTVDGIERSAGGEQTLTLEPDSSETVTIPLQYQREIPLASQTVEMRVDFADGSEVFSPAIFPVQIAARGFAARYWPYLLAALLVLLLIALVLLLVSRGVFKGRRLAVKVEMDGSDKPKFFTLAQKDRLFVAEGISGLDVGTIKRGEVLATMHGEGDELIMDLEDDDLLLGGGVRGNILGKTLKFRDRYGKFKGITISRKEG